MKVIYAHQEIPKDIKSIFLAGPTPRNNQVKSWRPEAIEILKNLGFEGNVFVPESENGIWQNEYGNQVEWEWEGLKTADCIVFWVPRDLQTMPGFITNIEWGKWYESGKVVLGYPEDAPKMDYMKYCALKYSIPLSNNLTDTLKSALIKLVK